MTGKEALNYVINEIDVSITRYHHPFYKTREMLNVIAKDIEALEILLKYDVLSVIGVDEDKEKIKWYISTHKKLDL